MVMMVCVYTLSLVGPVHVQQGMCDVMWAVNAGGAVHHLLENEAPHRHTRSHTLIYTHTHTDTDSHGGLERRLAALLFLKSCTWYNYDTVRGDLRRSQLPMRCESETGFPPVKYMSLFSPLSSTFRQLRDCGSQDRRYVPSLCFAACESAAASSGCSRCVQISCGVLIDGL